MQKGKKATFLSDLYRQNLHSRLTLLIKIPFDEQLILAQPLTCIVSLDDCLESTEQVDDRTI
jgi:hypothetical protein